MQNKIEERKMQIKKTKTLSSIALILLLTFSVLMVSMPTSKAQGMPLTNIPTYAFLTVEPNPVGVSQTVSVGFWLDKVPPTAAGPSGARWQGLKVTITKPDGTTQIMGPYTSDPVGMSNFNYVPDAVGNYTLQCSFPGQNVTGIGAVIPVPINDYYEPSTSSVVTLSVQQSPIASYPTTPLPTGYWQSPIDAQNRGWYTISGNWLAQGTGGLLFGQRAYNSTGNFNAYTTAPNSAHIEWTKSIAIGGLMGGEFGGGGTSAYNWGNTYTPMFVPPVILNGVLYYNSPVEPREGFYAVDLRTGQTLWYQNSTGPVTMLGAVGLNGYYGYAGITLGQIYNYISPNLYGGDPYLWFTQGTTWYMYDASTGNLILSMANATNLGNPETPGTVVERPNGELDVYMLNGFTNTLSMWNSSLAIPTLGTESTAAWCWRPPVGATLNWLNGIQWTVTAAPYPGQAISTISSNVILATTGSLFLPQNYQMEIGYSATTGQQLWVQNRTTPPGATSFNLMGPAADGVYTEFHESTMEWYGYSLATGAQIWGPTVPYTSGWGFYDSTSGSAYGILYATGYDGTVHAYNITSGQHLWDWYAGSSGYETAYGTWPLSTFGPITIADGKIYVGTCHGLVPPMFRGAQLYCLNATTGKELWSIDQWCGNTIAIADGSLVTLNGYDNQIYCFGPGQSATTVTTSPGINTNTQVLIKGTVTDQSPGQTCLGIPAAGTPAISDASMTQWMEYLYMQQPEPMNATGVPVTLTDIDPNGNTYTIGTTTSNIAGQYSYAFTPTVPGTYTIIATFGGSNSYYSSTAQTTMLWNTPAAATAAPTATPTSVANLYFVPAVIAIIVVIIIGFALLAILSLRKRP
jgi:outer membrane protein assembly factor BamB